MSLHQSSSNNRPREQFTQTTSGKKVPMAMSLMVESMVRMIQKARESADEINSDPISKDLNED